MTKRKKSHGQAPGFVTFQLDQTPRAEKATKVKPANPTSCFRCRIVKKGVGFLDDYDERKLTLT